MYRPTGWPGDNAERTIWFPSFCEIYQGDVLAGMQDADHKQSLGKREIEDQMFPIGKSPQVGCKSLIQAAAFGIFGNERQQIITSGETGFRLGIAPGRQSVSKDGIDIRLCNLREPEGSHAQEAADRARAMNSAALTERTRSFAMSSSPLPTCSRSVAR